MTDRGKTMPDNQEYHEDSAYRVASGLALAVAFVLFWLTAAVGIIGDGPINLLYLGVLALGFAGAYFARLQPSGMALALIGTAIAQLLVPVIALVIWKAGGADLLTNPDSPHPPFHPGIMPVFGLNAVFVLLWCVSAGLFRKTASGPRARGT